MLGSEPPRSVSDCESDIVQLSRDLITSLTCDKCCEDGYNIENLLAPSSTVDQNPDATSIRFPRLDFSSKSLCDPARLPKPKVGFMVASFVRPPVTLKWRFRESIDLQAVHLGLSIGNQKTMGFQIFVGNTQENGASVGDRGLEIERRVASVFFSNSSLCPSQCLISRRNCGIDEKFASISKSGGSSDGNGEIFYFTKTYLLDKVKILTIKIMKAHYIPCLPFVKIFVKRSISDQQIDKSTNSDQCFGVSKNMQRSALEKSPHSASISGDCGSKIDSSQRLDSSVDAQRTSAGDQDHEINDVGMVPKEFFDPITNLCMSLPIILPSGHTIDRSTLEKYLDEEARYGRSANDPFTNVRFSDSSAPIPNNRLKERIDKFFLTRPELAKEQDFGRTLCGGGEYAAVRNSRMAVSEEARKNFLKRKATGEGSSSGNATRSFVCKGSRIGGHSDKAGATSVTESDAAPDYLRNLLQDLPSFL